MVPPVYGLPKDHKPLTPGREDLGHPLRPVCGATECINGPLSNLLTEILTVVGDMADVEMQGVFIPHLTSMPKGFKAISKELHRLAKLLGIPTALRQCCLH